MGIRNWRQKAQGSSWTAAPAGGGGGERRRRRGQIHLLSCRAFHCSVLYYNFIQQDNEYIHTMFTVLTGLDHNRSTAEVNYKPIYILFLCNCFTKKKVNCFIQYIELYAIYMDPYISLSFFYSLLYAKIVFCTALKMFTQVFKLIKSLKTLN
jgi:hypothetical protein